VTVAPPRWVLHVDMDAFYASVEAKERPELRGLPLAVGGAGPRGVVASASYEARYFGVRSAMPSARAKRLCPSLVFVQPRFELYHDYSRRLRRLLASFSPLVEGIALDEAFLDISGAGALHGPPVQVAWALRALVLEELGLGCSVGAGPNKLVAKLASEAAKPKAGRNGAVPGPGVVIVAAEEVLSFLWPMPVRALFGVGPASAERLRRLGIATVGELASQPEERLVALLGKANGKTLHALAWGRDDRPVVADSEPKSIGHEETFPEDIADREELGRRLVAMADAVAARVREHKLVARTVTLKVRYGNFATITRSRTFPTPQANGPALWAAAGAMLDGLDVGKGVRLLGVAASGLLPAERAPGEQLQLGLAGAPRAGDEAGWERASRAVDAVRARFGQAALGPASTVPLRRDGGDEEVE
jgi:DNA polymerase-4